MVDFMNINGVYAKDIELRNGIDALRTTVLSNTIKPLTVTNNGTYTAIPSSGTYGYSPITVDVQEEPWKPLEDGYSNFWFELTDDTLSPWLKFSAKNNDAVINWGDGSGEQSLDTLTPTHTYSKAGRYVVKVKGVTGIALMESSAIVLPLIYVELNNEVTDLSQHTFRRMYYMRRCVSSGLNSIGSSSSFMNSGIEEISLPNGVVTISQSAFHSAFALQKVTLGNAVTTIQVYAFYSCPRLKEVHIKAETPPTLAADVFAGVTASNFIIYVPVGTGDTYKATAGWSTYADHILEEGQTPNSLMMAKFNSDNADNEEMR